jgi:hypothetical protein
VDLHVADAAACEGDTNFWKRDLVPVFKHGSLKKHEQKLPETRYNNMTCFGKRAKIVRAIW